jgi:hypothetical protein
MGVVEPSIKNRTFLKDRMSVNATPHVRFALLEPLALSGVVKSSQMLLTARFPEEGQVAIIVMEHVFGRGQFKASG